MYFSGQETHNHRRQKYKKRNMPTTKHRQIIEQQLKSDIILKISPVFPEDIASLIIQGATTEVQTLSDTEIINFINNDDTFQSGMTLSTSTVGLI